MEDYSINMGNSDFDHFLHLGLGSHVQRTFGVLHAG